MPEITENVREHARRLLEEDKVDVVIGYQEAWDGVQAAPCFVDRPDDVGKLVYNDRCTANLAKYLVGREGYLTSRFRPSSESVRVALVAHPAAMRTLVALMREYQFAREDVTVLGITDGNPVGLEPDVVVGQIEPQNDGREQLRARIVELSAMSPPERKAWWNAQFAKCIRCYACRQVCPFCYCEECIAEENQPQWIDRSPALWNNIGWNLIRAYHLTGRCTDCGECDRVCPVDIPLRLINLYMVDQVEDAFDFVAGVDPEAEPALAAFQTTDKAGFVR
jgi:ferredoxin